MFTLHQPRVRVEVMSDHVERLDNLYGRKLTLNLFPNRVSVRDRKGRRHALREVKRIRNVYEDLSIQILVTSRSQGFQRARARSAVEDDLAKRCSICESTTGSVLAVRFRPALGLLGGTGTHPRFVT